MCFQCLSYRPLSFSCSKNSAMCFLGKVSLLLHCGKHYLVMPSGDKLGAEAALA